MPSNQIQAIRSNLWQNGFRPVAVYNPDATDWKGQPIDDAGKRPKADDWPEKARQNPPVASIEMSSPDAQNTGVLCDGLRGIDIDIDDSALVEQIGNLASMHLGWSLVRTRQGSSRCLLMYRAADGEPRKFTLKGASGKIEVLGWGQQFVAFGLHPSGAAYEWKHGGPDKFALVELTPISENDLFGFLCACAPLIGAETPGHPSDAAEGILTQQRHISGAEPTDADRENARTVLARISAKLSAATSGRYLATWNSAREAGGYVGNRSLDHLVAAESIFQACVANGIVSKHGPEKIQKQIRNGLASGTAAPFELGSVAGAQGAQLIANSRSAQTSEVSGMLVRASTVKPRRNEWLWPGYLVRNKLSLLAGVGGVGKSTITFTWASIISNGGIWPDGSRCEEAGNVLIWSSEDEFDTDIAPRLIAAGANLDRCMFINGPIKGTSFDPAKDMGILREQVSTIGGVGFLIIDPIMNAVAGDAYKPNVVRRSLQPFVDFSREFRCCVLGITHFTKNTSGKTPSERILGSGAFKDFSRMALVAVQDEETEECAFARAKTNIASNRGGFAYRIIPCTIPDPDGGDPIGTTRIEFGEYLDKSARSIFADYEHDENEKDIGAKIATATNLLKERLSYGPVLARDLFTMAKEGYQISEKTLKRAKAQLPIQSIKQGYQGEYVWQLSPGLLPEK